MPHFTAEHLRYSGGFVANVGKWTINTSFPGPGRGTARPLLTQKAAQLWPQKDAALCGSGVGKAKFFLKLLYCERTLYEKNKTQPTTELPYEWVKMAHRLGGNTAAILLSLVTSVENLLQDANDRSMDAQVS